MYNVHTIFGLRAGWSGSEMVIHGSHQTYLPRKLLSPGSIGLLNQHWSLGGWYTATLTVFLIHRIFFTLLEAAILFHFHI
jgi:hypothetical protein